jgi:hypothetical protein
MLTARALTAGSSIMAAAASAATAKKAMIQQVTSMRATV